MKTSWVIGLVFLFILMQILTSIAIGSDTLLPATGGDFNTGQLDTLMKPSGFDFSNPLVAVYSVVKGVWSFFVAFINMLFWNYPTLFTGNWIYVKWLVFMPISGAMVFSIIVIMRGSSSA